VQQRADPPAAGMQLAEGRGGAVGHDQGRRLRGVIGDIHGRA
jgi:hypothetical protein